MTASVTPLRTSTARVAIVRVDEATHESHAAVGVTLEWDGDQHTGEASGPPSMAHRPGMVAAATLRAVASMTDVAADFRAVEASIVETGGTEVALVMVDHPDAPRHLVGNAVIEEGNLQMAVTRATLDAVNRRLSQVL